MAAENALSNNFFSCKDGQCTAHVWRARPYLRVFVRVSNNSTQVRVLHKLELEVI